ncbi:hypothetical protein ACOMHN_016558 [Nucella lapillus]
MAVERLALSRTWGVVVVVVVMKMVVGWGQGMDVAGVSPSHNGGEEGKGGEGLRVMWGIADTTSSVGRLFRYHIPSDAFQGPVESFQVVEAEKDALPSWMQYVPDQHVLQGLPAPGDAGRVYLQVTARGPHGATAADVFSLTVSPETPSMSAHQPLRFKSSGPQAVRCKREEPETVATIVLDADLNQLPVGKRLELLAAFLKHMGLGEDMVRMGPAAGQALHDDSALVTGTGDARGEPQHPGVRVSWLVGCGKVESSHFPALHKLDDDSSSGVMGRALGHPVLGWRVTNSRLQQQQQQQQHLLKRRRRQARATPTPVLTVTTATATGVDDSMTRPVVDMSSPTFTIEPTPSQPEMPKTTQPEMMKTTPPTDTKPEECVSPKVNEDYLKTPFRLPVLLGQVVDFRLPEDLFEACSMGGTSHTKLSLFRRDDEGNSLVMEPDWFLKFDQKSQTIRGMALDDKDVGRHPLKLVAMLKTHDFITSFLFEVVVRKARGRKARVNHALSMTIDADYKQFMASTDQKVDLATKVAGVFGDKDTNALTITKIAPGSIIYSFTNNTLSGGGCPVEEVTGLADRLVTADGQLNPEAMKKLKPWVLTGAATAPAGDCEGNPNFPKRSASIAKPPEQDKTTAKPDQPKPDGTDKPDVMEKPKTTGAPPNITGVASAGASGDDNIWITTVVPAVVIVAIILIALLVACILYRKKRKGKMTLEDQNTFVNKGAPVIFPDELDDKPSDSTKPLLIEGSPPAPPPEYHRGDSEGSDLGSHKEATPPTDEVDAEIEIDATSPLYQPPPPVPASSGKQARPHVQQPYRSQPPEIHP